MCVCLQFWGKDRARDLDLAVTSKFMLFTSINIWKYYKRLPKRVCDQRRGPRTEARETDHPNIYRIVWEQESAKKTEKGG